MRDGSIRNVDRRGVVSHYRLIEENDSKTTLGPKDSVGQGKKWQGGGIARILGWHFVAPPREESLKRRVQLLVQRTSPSQRSAIGLRSVTVPHHQVM